MKKLINNPQDLVNEMVDGLVAQFPALARLSAHNVLVRADIDRIRDEQVALISGGGSGHEPAHAGYIGHGMLTAAVAGEVFTSPSAASVYAAIKAAAGKHGALLIVKNYTGDRLNFGLAAEMARAEGIKVEMIIVADDVALVQAKSIAGRRGIAGTILVHKIAGAAAAERKTLDEVKKIAQEAADNVSTMGLSLSPGTVPSIGKPNFELADDEIELGLGIHGEPGIRRVNLESADALTDKLIDGIFAARSMPSGSRAVLLINNLGATTQMELAVVARRAAVNLEQRGIQLERIYSGTFMSSVDTAGISLSLLIVDDDRLRRLDADTSAPAWPRMLPQRPGPLKSRVFLSSTPMYAALPVQGGHAAGAQTRAARMLERAIRSACDALVKAEDLLTRLDQAVGDGDLGISLARAARSVQSTLAGWPLDDPASALKALALHLQDTIGGSSGPLYGVLFLRAAASLPMAANLDIQDFAAALKQGCQALGELGGAAEGDRTMLDALIPFQATLANALTSGEAPGRALDLACAGAERGAEATSQMVARAGRTSYLGQRALGHPDPGAVAVSIWLRAVAATIENAEPQSGL